MNIYGGIPDKITYVVKKAVQVHRGWHGVDIDLMSLAAPVKAIPAFPVDPSSKTALDTAMRWAREASHPSPHVETDNAPIAEVEIITIEARAEGGRAYKVRLRGVHDGSGGDSLYADMREDVVLDAMLVNGVKKGGTLKGPFVWGRLQSQLRLVRVGSTLHTAMVEAAKRMAKALVHPKYYIKGGIYLTRKGEAVLYLGKCDYDEFAYVYESKEQQRWGINGRIARKEVRDGHLWYGLRTWGADPKKKDAEHWVQSVGQLYKPETIWIFGMRRIKQARVNELIHAVDIDWDKLRSAAVGWALDPTHRYCSSSPEEQLMHASAMAHVRPAGEPCPVHPQYAALAAKADNPKDTGGSR